MIEDGSGPEGRLGAARRLVPGLVLSGTIALAATFLSEHYGGPAMLFALLLGIAFHFLHEEGPCREGVEFAARHVLRFGVALLGMRITLGQILDLGLGSLVVIVALVAMTILAGLGLARALGKGWALGLLSGGAVAICGASAALAIAAILPRREGSETETLRTVVGVTTLSTVAMIAYPPLFALLGLDDREIGFMLGATIHDVAQVVGAGYSVSETAGDTAMLVKLLRVALLPVVLMGAVLCLPRGGAGGKVALLPGFMVAFLALSLAGSFLPVPDALRAGIDGVSRWALVVAIAALGVKTELRTLAEGGAGHVAMLALETLFLMGALLLGHFVLAL